MACATLAASVAPAGTKNTASVSVPVRGSFVPQVAKVMRGGSVRDLSLLMLLTFNGGVLLWLIYGLLLHALPMIVTNGATLVLAGYLLVRKLTAESS